MKSIKNAFTYGSSKLLFYIVSKQAQSKTKFLTQEITMIKNTFQLQNKNGNKDNNNNNSNIEQTKISSNVRGYRTQSKIRCNKITLFAHSKTLLKHLTTEIFLN